MTLLFFVMLLLLLLLLLLGLIKHKHARAGTRKRRCDFVMMSRDNVA